MQKLLLIVIMSVAATVASYSQDTNAPSIKMLVTPQEKKMVEMDRIRRVQYETMQQIAKVTDTNKLAKLTAAAVAAQDSLTAPSVKK
jgi:hypothetical protein